MFYAVTGGAGFIGGHLVRLLADEGHDIIVIDNMSRGSLNNLDEMNDRIQVCNVDITDQDALGGIMTATDGIFHLAGLTSVPESFQIPQEYHRVNVGGTNNVFRIAAHTGQRVVYASSVAVYGMSDTTPIPETAQRNPVNPYGHTKLQCELAAEKYPESEMISLRYFNVYGRGHTGVVGRFLKRIQSGLPPIILGDGTQERDFVFVTDVVRANIAAMQAKTGRGFFNIGTGHATSIATLARTMISIAKQETVPIYGPPSLGDVTSSRADVRLAERLLSWSASTSLADGLATLF